MRSTRGAEAGVRYQDVDRFGHIGSRQSHVLTDFRNDPTPVDFVDNHNCLETARLETRSVLNRR